MPTTSLPRRLHHLAALSLLIVTLAAWLFSDFYTASITYAPTERHSYSLSLSHESLVFHSDDLTHYDDGSLYITPGWQARIYRDPLIPIVPRPEFHPAILGFYHGSASIYLDLAQYNHYSAFAIPFWFLALLAFLHYRLAAPARPDPFPARPSPRWTIPLLASFLLTTLAFWIFTDFYSVALVHYSAATHTNYVFDEDFDALSFQSTHLPPDLDARIAPPSWSLPVNKQTWSGTLPEYAQPDEPIAPPIYPLTLLGFSAGYWEEHSLIGPVPTFSGTRLTLPLYFPTLLLAHLLHLAIKSRRHSHPAFPLTSLPTPPPPPP